MASARQGNTILHQNVIDELLKEAENIALPANGNNDVMMTGKIRNDTRGSITLQDNKDWSGSVFGSYPPSINLRENSAISHHATPPHDTEGSKGAVVYYGTNEQGKADNCAWVFSWSVPGNGSNKVHVETGSNATYPKHAIEWDKILAKLDKSGPKSSYKDSNGTGAEAYAEITSDKLAANAAVVFHV